MKIECDGEMPTVQQTTKKPYVTPVLSEFGTLRNLTLNVGMMGLSDGGAATGAMMTN